MDLKLLREKLGNENFKKLEALKNAKLMEFASKYVELFNPDSVFVRTDSKEDAGYIRKRAIELGEEKELA
ncbi:MAG: phosphoenolpyruvate carboxykinase, partial [Candidatus Omnitrophica bacterium]|nr:phosphoenolpyruvate carboxykinase [Candidatus Omnitrophota bacterium]